MECITGATTRRSREGSRVLWWRVVVPLSTCPQLLNKPQNEISHRQSFPPRSSNLVCLTHKSLIDNEINRE